jgi:hypothetical protein
MSKPKSLADCEELVRKKEAFNWHHVYALYREANALRIEPSTYTVYSYGIHYPMYVYDYEACQWYGNKDKSTPTTNRHMSRFKPYSVAQWVDTETLSSIAMRGIVQTSAKRME